jgi:hypothetical protein
MERIIKNYGEFINEAYITKERVKEVRDQLRKEFPDFKFSITREHSSVINIKILSGPIPLTDKPDGYEQVNHMWLPDHFKDRPEAMEFLMKVKEIANKGNYDKSDIMTDYFDVGFYLHMSIGEWDKPYEVIPPKPSLAKMKLYNKALKQFPNSPMQLKTKQEIDDLNRKEKGEDFEEEHPKELRSFESKKEKDIETLKREYKKIVKEYEDLKKQKHPANNPSDEVVQSFYDKCDEMGAKMKEMLKLDKTMNKDKALL